MVGDSSIINKHNKKFSNCSYTMALIINYIAIIHKFVQEDYCNIRYEQDLRHNVRSSHSDKSIQ